MMCFTYIMYKLRSNNKEIDNNVNNFLDTQYDRQSYDIKNNHLRLHTDKPISEDFNSNYLQINDGLNHNKYKNDKDKRNKEWQSRKCLKSTVDNPFMNPNVFTPRNIGPNCSPLSEETKTKINKNFNAHLYKDSNDIYSTRNSDRQFYTVPGNTFPNDRDTLMKWCYSTPKTCKEGNGAQCVANNHSRMYGVHKSIH